MQTCTISNRDVVLAGIALRESEAIEVTRQVICRTGVRVPIGVHRVGLTASVHCVGSMLVVLLWLIGVVEVVAATERVMAILVAHLRAG